MWWAVCFLHLFIFCVAGVSYWWWLLVCVCVFIVVYISVDQTSTADERMKKNQRIEDLLIAASLPHLLLFSFISTNRYSLRVQPKQQTNMLAAIKKCSVWFCFLASNIVLYFVAHFHYSLLDSSAFKHEKTKHKSI